MSISLQVKRLLPVFSALICIVILLAIIRLWNTNECTGNYQFGKAKQAWQTGDLTVLVRHTEKCSAVPGACPPEDLGITDEGIRQAKLIKEGMSLFGEADTDIFYSPTPRTELTARYAFNGNMEVAQWLMEDCDNDFLGKIRQVKKPGTNLVLVTHSGCLNSLLDTQNHHMLDFDAGDDDYFGMALLLRATEMMGTEPLGCIVPSNWQTNPNES